MIDPASINWTTGEGITLEYLIDGYFGSTSALKGVCHAYWDGFIRYPTGVYRAIERLVDPAMLAAAGMVSAALQMHANAVQERQYQRGER